MQRSDVRYLVGLSQLPGIGPARLVRLIERFKQPERAWRASEQELTQVGIDAKQMPELLQQRRGVDLDAEMDRLERLGVRLLTIFDAEYPLRLKEIYNAPVILYVRGELTPDDEQSIGVVGTRSPTVYGKELAARIVPQLAGAGLTIVSGLARGIDTIAHTGALKAEWTHHCRAGLRHRCDLPGREPLTVRADSRAWRSRNGIFPGNET